MTSVISTLSRQPFLLNDTFISEDILEKAISFYDDNEYAKASILFQKILHINPALPHPYYYLASISACNKEWDNVIKFSASYLQYETS